tara:strand:+ start:3547 stop:4299 length:753 start_codon:yes stop_codon:yes gene_type:complete
MVEIRAEGLEPEALNDAISRAFAAIEQVHQSMSQQLPESELSRLNRAPLMQVIEVSKHFTNVLTEARELASLSAGAFQPCLANAQSRNIQDIDVIGQGLVRRQLDVKVDLDGIAKGYAVDCALEELQARGVSEAMVNAGGDMRCFGSETCQAFIRDPAHPHASGAVVQLHNEALATSASYETSEAGQALPVSAHWKGCWSVSVVAPRAIHADALTKVVLMLPPGESEKLLSRYRAHCLRLGDLSGVSLAA